MKLKKKYPLSKKDSRKLIQTLRGMGYIIETPITKIQYVELEGGYKLYIIDKAHAFIELRSGLIIPFLASKPAMRLKRIEVDEGAIKHILNGADVMAPGVTKAPEEAVEGEIVLIMGAGKPLAIGRLLSDWKEKLKERRGKMVKNLHYIGDKIWKTAKTLIIQQFEHL